MTHYRATWLVLATFLLVGCGSGIPPRVTGSVSGTVLQGGKPLETGVILLVDSERGISASAMITAGQFRFTDPVDTGNFKVAVMPPPQPPPHEMSQTPVGPVVKIPARYTKPDSSGLTANVVEGNNEFEFKIN